MITRRIQRAILGALSSYSVTAGGVDFNPIAQVFAHMDKNGRFPDGWVPDASLTPDRVYAEKPPDNLRVHPFICMHNSMHPVASHTGDVTVVDADGMNPESYPGHTCWATQWNVYAEDVGGTAARAERLRELIDAAMEIAIARDRMDFSLPEDTQDSVPVASLPIPPIVRPLLVRRSGLTQPYDEWYDGRRYWWRGIRYDFMLEEVPPVHSSMR